MIFLLFQSIRRPWTHNCCRQGQSPNPGVQFGWTIFVQIWRKGQSCRSILLSVGHWLLRSDASNCGFGHSQSPHPTVHAIRAVHFTFCFAARFSARCCFLAGQTFGRVRFQQTPNFNLWQNWFQRRLFIQRRRQWWRRWIQWRTSKRNVDKNVRSGWLRFTRLPQDHWLWRRITVGWISTTTRHCRKRKSNFLCRFTQQPNLCLQHADTNIRISLRWSRFGST